MKVDKNKSKNPLKRQKKHKKWKNSINYKNKKILLN
jgi:hypothetical protein